MESLKKIEIQEKDRIKRIFPAYFSQFQLPEGAREERIKVYRACRSGKCDAMSFVSTYEQQGCKMNVGDDMADPGLYSLSTYEKPNHIKRFANLTSDMQVPYKIAIGYTEPIWGLVQPTRERKKKAQSHVDWWLYENATPHLSFELIPDFEEHLEVYLKEREEKNV